MQEPIEMGDYGLARVDPDYGYEDRLSGRVVYYDDDALGCEEVDNLNDEVRAQLRKEGRCLVEPELKCGDHEGGSGCRCHYPKAICYPGDPWVIDFYHVLDLEALLPVKDESACLGLPVNNFHVRGPDKGVGWFYAVQLSPTLNPQRIKLGYSWNLPSRFRSYLTSNPEAVLAGAWPCTSAEEGSALTHAANHLSCHRVRNSEVFDALHVQQFLAGLEAYFKKPKIG